MLTPYLVWVKGFAVFIFIALLAFCIYKWRDSIITNTTNKVNAEWLQREAKANDAAQKILEAKNAEIHERQVAIDAALQNINKKNQEIADAKKSYDILFSQYTAGVKRLSIRVSSPGTTNTAGKNSDPTSSSGNHYEVRELMPEISGDILSFARGYSENLLKLNSCIVMYNAVRDGQQ